MRSKYDVLFVFVDSYIMLSENGDPLLPTEMRELVGRTGRMWACCAARECTSKWDWGAGGVHYGDAV